MVRDGAEAVGRPARRALDELLGGDRSPAAASAPSAGAGGGRERNAAHGRAATLLATHRRAATGAICSLLVAASAIAGIPAASATAAAPADVTAAVPNDMPADGYVALDPYIQGAYGDADYVVYNVMEPEIVAGSSGGFQVYVVQGGDTLSKIGAKFGLSSSAVYWANSTRLSNPNSLRIGQKLTIPPTNGMTVTVKSGETLSGLASKYKTTVKAIQATNGLTGTTLTLGQVLLLPVTPPAIPNTCGAACAGWTGQRLKWPVPSSHRITQYYSRSHWAVDIAAHTGAPVVAAYSGTVIWAGWKTGYGSGGGIVVWLSHGGQLWSTYNHLSRVNVRKGQTVKAGQTVGAIGSTGLSTGPHLHFEVWSCYPWTGGSTSCAKNPLNYM